MASQRHWAPRDRAQLLYHVRGQRRHVQPQPSLAAEGWPLGLTADAEGVPSHLQVADGHLPARQFLSHHPSLTFATMLTQGFDASSVRLDVVEVEAGARLRLDCW